MLGMEMMLKSFGFDPEQFKQWMAELMQFAQGVQTELKSISEKQDRILQMLGQQGENNERSANTGTEPARIGIDTNVG